MINSTSHQAGARGGTTGSAHKLGRPQAHQCAPSSAPLQPHHRHTPALTCSCEQHAASSLHPARQAGARGGNSGLANKLGHPQAHQCAPSSAPLHPHHRHAPQAWSPTSATPPPRAPPINISIVLSCRGAAAVRLRCKEGGEEDWVLPTPRALHPPAAPSGLTACHGPPGRRGTATARRRQRGRRTQRHVP